MSGVKRMERKGEKKNQKMGVRRRRGEEFGGRWQEDVKEKRRKWRRRGGLSEVGSVGVLKMKRGMTWV